MHLMTGCRDSIQELIPGLDPLDDREGFIQLMPGLDAVDPGFYDGTQCQESMHSIGVIPDSQ
jgi:hypothetical protein